MFKRDKILIGSLFIGFLFLLSVTASFAQYAVGDTVTNFTHADIDGNQISLADYKGKIIVLNFFASW